LKCSSQIKASDFLLSVLLHDWGDSFVEIVVAVKLERISPIFLTELFSEADVVSGLVKWDKEVFLFVE
jgi:hypothetical protein